MRITTDNFPLYIALACACVSFVVYLIQAIIGRNSKPLLTTFARACYYISFASVSYATLYLLQMILSGARYDIGYIYNNSGPKDGLLYQISSLWAGQQGSLLFWAFLGGLIGLAFIRKVDEEAPMLLSFWCSIQAFFLILLVRDDPFARLAGFQPDMVGAGLNALLKNPWMAIHPPIVFLGYAALAVPAAFAIHGLIKGDISKWANKSLPWALFGWVTLTAGIALGMIWSYEVLGWGGYWGWDPVENASLVPWLTGTALLHGLLIQRYRGRMARWNVVLSLGTFLLIIYATFLTRSGALASYSNHSFADLGAYSYLLGFLIFYVVACALLVLCRWNIIPEAPKELSAKSKDFVIISGIIGVVLFALVVLVGTSSPLFTQSAVQPGFFNRMSLPLAILAVLLISLSPFLGWSRKAAQDGGASGSVGSLLVITAVMAVVGIALVSGILIKIAPNTAERCFSWITNSSPNQHILAIPSLLLLLGIALIAFIVSAPQCFKSPLIRSGAHIAHIGVALMIIGIVMSSGGKSVTLPLVKGEHPKSAFGYSFACAGITNLNSSKAIDDVRIEPDIEVVNIHVTHGRSMFNAPVKTGRGAIRSPYIRSTALSDLYISAIKIYGGTVTATASMTDQGYMAHPVSIPGSDATLTLEWMQVESNIVKLEYAVPGKKPVDITVSMNKPVLIDGYKIEFLGYVTDGKGMRYMTVGADLRVSGQNITEKAIISVSKKPLISLLWIGLVLVFTGGVLAIIRRRSENLRNKWDTTQ